MVLYYTLSASWTEIFLVAPLADRYFPTLLVRPYDTSMAEIIVSFLASVHNKHHSDYCADNDKRIDWST